MKPADKAIDKATGPNVAPDHITLVTWPRGRPSVTLAALADYLGDDAVLQDRVHAHPLAAVRPYPAQKPGQRWLVEYEEFAHGVVLLYDAAVASGTSPDSAAAFRRFASEQFTLYKAFLNRWVNAPAMQDEIIVNLADVRTDPLPWLHWVLGMLNPAVPPPAALLDRVTAGVGRPAADVSPDLTAFRYYDAALFEMLSLLVLRRDLVMKTFEELMHRPVGEETILRLQASRNLTRLRENLMSSKEYRQRVGGVIAAGGTQDLPLTPDQVRFGCELFLGRVPTETEVQKISGKHYTSTGLRDLLVHSTEFRQRNGLMARSEAETPPTLIHLHMPKTAGTSLNVLLEQNYPRTQMLDIQHGTLHQLRGMDPAARAELRVIRGHLMHGVATWLPQPSLYVSLLRRPGPRIHSFYQYIRRQPKHPLHTDLNATDMSFGQFLALVGVRSDLRSEIDNGQCRRIAGRMAETDFGQEQQIFRQAVSHVFAPDMIFGLTEHFAGFLALLKARGLLTHYSPIKVNTAPESTDMAQVLAALTPDERRLFDGYIQWDDWLYDICEQVWSDRHNHKALLT